MVLQVAYSVLSAVFPTKYYVHIGVSILALVVTYAFAQGRTTNRERDLHTRVVIVTGAFTPLGLTLVAALANRGAHVIAISDYPLDHAYPSLLIPLLRSTSNNENIFAEYADLTSPASIREFCTRFLTGQDQRLDAIVFGHEYRAIGSLLRRSHGKAQDTERRDTASLATFLMMTLLLPALLVEPAERDIRIVNIINPFYAASAVMFTSQLTSPAASPPSPFLQEGFRALRTVILTRHLQRVLDSLPNQAPPSNSDSIPGSSEPDLGPSTKPDVKRPDPQPSNIIAVSACPGFSRKDTIVPLLGAERDADGERSVLGLVIYILLFPFFLLLTKSPNASLQSVLHVLFLPTPLKRALAHVDAAINPSLSTEAPDATSTESPQPRIVDKEVLKPGALYRECAVVQLSVPSLPDTRPSGEHVKKETEKQKDAKKTTVPGEPEVGFPDDGEFGGEAVGRVVWEWYEENLKKWEARSKETEKQEAQAKETEKQEAGAEAQRTD